MKRKYIRSGDINITNKEDDKDEDVNLDINEDDDSLDLDTDGEEDSIDFGEVSAEGEGDVDEGFMEEVNSIDEFGADSPTLSKEEVVDAVQAIDQIIEVILATEGVTDGEKPSSEEVNFVLDEVQDLAAGFDSAPSDDAGDGFGGDDLGELPPETEPLGEFDEAGFDEGVDEEFPEEIEASLVRVMVAGKPVKSKFTQPYIASETLSGSPVLLCSNLGTAPVLEEEDEPAKDAICETAVLSNDLSKSNSIVSKFTRVGSLKKWVMQSKSHKLAWKIASAKYRRLVGQSAKTPREKAAVFFLANNIHSKYALLLSSGKKISKIFAGRSVRALRRVGVALHNRYASHKPMRVLFSDYNGYRNYETWNASLYINKDTALCNQAKRLVRSGVVDYDQLIGGLGLAGKKTPDGVAWSSPKIDRGEMREVLSGLVSSFSRGGNKMAKRNLVKSNWESDLEDEAIQKEADSSIDFGLLVETARDFANRRGISPEMLNRMPTSLFDDWTCEVDRELNFKPSHSLLAKAWREGVDPTFSSVNYNGGNKMAKRNIRSSTQYDSQGDLITVQDDTPSGLGFGSQTLSDSNIEDPNTEKVLGVNGGDTSDILDVHNTGDEGSLEADTKAGEENSVQEYGFDSQDMVGVELPIEGEDKTQVLELRNIGSGVYILNRTFESPGAGRLSFCEGKEATKLLSRNVQSSAIKTSVDRCLTFNNGTVGIMLRSSAILGVIAVKAPRQKGLKNSKYSVFSRVGVNLINDEGYFIKAVRGARNIIASAASLKNARKGKEIKDIFSEVEGAYVKYLRSKVSRLLKANTVLKGRLENALKVQQRRNVLNSQLLNKERRSAREQVASAMQGLDSLKKSTAEAEAQRLLASSASAVREDLLSQKARDEAAVDHLTRMMRW